MLRKRDDAANWPQGKTAPRSGSSAPGAHPSGAAAGTLVDPVSAVAVLDREVPGLSTDEAISGLEEVRRLRSWLAHREHLLVLQASDQALRDHEDWVEATTLYSEQDSAFGRSNGSDSPGLTKAQRVAVGDRSALAQIATALHISERSASSLRRHARRLAEAAPATCIALEAWSITAESARVVTDAMGEFLDGCDEKDPVRTALWNDAAVRVQRALLPVAASGSPSGSLRVEARKVREAVHPDSFPTRAARACEGRYVSIRPGVDGMAHLHASLPAAAASNIHRRLTALAHDALAAEGGGSRWYTDRDAEPAGEVRTVPQAMADVFSDLLGGLTGANPWLGQALPGGGPSEVAPNTSEPAESQRRAATDSQSGSDRQPEPPNVLVTIPISTLLGGDNPAELAGFGPIAADDARHLASTATSCGIALLTSGPEQDWFAATNPALRHRTQGSGNALGTGPPSDTEPPDIDPSGVRLPSAEPPEDEPPGHESAAYELSGLDHGPDCADPSLPARNAAVPAVGGAVGKTGDTGDTDDPWERWVDDAADLATACAALESALGSSLTNGKQYRMPAALRRRLQHRDRTCRFPGCARPAAGCDIDHIQAWSDNGETTAANLAHLCRRHHTLKHHSAWHVEVESRPGLRADAGLDREPGGGFSRDSSAVLGGDFAEASPSWVSPLREPGGTLVWITPTGRRYQSRGGPIDPPF